jgi:uncharacterized protein YecT (DUF1311 family)
MKVTYILLGSAFLIISHSAAWSLSDQECDYAGNQSQMNACAERDFETADRELNLTYKQLMSSIPETKKKELQKEQRSWLKTRDPKCREEANDEAEGGSMWAMLYQSCRATATQSRIKILKQWEK